MPKKRKNRGRSKGDKGKSRLVQCDCCGRWVPEDKAIVVTRMYSPVDPQLAVSQNSYYPAASILAALEVENPNRDDQTLIMADMARKAINQVYHTVYKLLRSNNMEEDKAHELAKKLSEGQWTHDYPISVDEAREMGLPVSEDMPKEIYALMDLYPQPAQRRPSVEFIPTPYRPAPPARPNQGNS